MGMAVPMCEPTPVAADLIRVGDHFYKTVDGWTSVPRLVVGNGASAPLGTLTTPNVIGGMPKTRKPITAAAAALVRTQWEQLASAMDRGHLSIDEFRRIEGLAMEPTPFSRFDVRLVFDQLGQRLQYRDRESCADWLYADELLARGLISQAEWKLKDANGRFLFIVGHVNEADSHARAGYLVIPRNPGPKSCVGPPTIIRNGMEYEPTPFRPRNRRRFFRKFVRGYGA